MNRQGLLGTLRVAPCGCTSLIDLLNVIDYKSKGHVNGRIRFHSALKQRPEITEVLRRWNDEPVTRSCLLNLRAFYDSGLDGCNLTQWAVDAQRGCIDSLPGCRGAAVCVTGSWLSASAFSDPSGSPGTLNVEKLRAAALAAAGKVPGLVNMVSRCPEAVVVAVTAGRLIASSGEPLFTKAGCVLGEVTALEPAMKRALRVQHGVFTALLGLPEDAPQAEVVRRVVDVLRGLSPTAPHPGRLHAKTIDDVLAAARGLDVPASFS